ncbi:hypothetical protein GOODEAATRI_025345 [Goodea atripinnis]|uniref:Secreted protein n=1 Tax=Goodea atripinnis TaxID=208336 RepID=A0ABV0MKN8_9TELE
MDAVLWLLLRVCLCLGRFGSVPYKLNGLNHDFDHPCLILAFSHTPTATLRTQRRVFGSSEVPYDTDRVTLTSPQLNMGHLGKGPLCKYFKLS